MALPEPDPWDPNQDELPPPEPETKPMPPTVMGTYRDHENADGTVVNPALYYLALVRWGGQAEVRARMGSFQGLTQVGLEGQIVHEDPNAITLILETPDKDFLAGDCAAGWGDPIPGGGQRFYFGGRGTPGLYLLQQTHLDAGNLIQCRATSREVAPAGIGGECEFRQVHLTLSAWTTGTVVVTPIVDGERKPEASRVVEFTSDGSFEFTRRFELALYEPVVVGGQEIGRRSLRGTWIQFDLEVLDLWGCGRIYLEGMELELDVVEESVTHRSYSSREMDRRDAQDGSHLVFGTAAGADLLEWAGGQDDLGTPVEPLVRSRPVAPAGMNLDAVFTRLYLSIRHAFKGAVTVNVTPIVDNRRLPSLPVELPASSSPTTESLALHLWDHLFAGEPPDVVGPDDPIPEPVEPMGRKAVRGTWFRVEVTLAGGSPGGWLELAGVELEWEPAQESEEAL